MKTFLYLSAIIPLMFCSGCTKQNDDRVDVKNYVEQLKEGSYTSLYLPEFSVSDIPELLKYRNDRTIIYQVPANLISSLLLSECRLGVIILWNIESIRAVEANSPDLIGRWPSQNPLLVLRESPHTWVVDKDSHFTAAKAYYNWWNSYPSVDRMMLNPAQMKTDPLKSTKYMWH